MKTKWKQLSILLLAILFFQTISHGCRLESPIIEKPMPFVFLTLCGVWIIRSKSTKKAWIYLFISIVTFIVIDQTYHSWLHSDSFPENLLSKEAVQWKATVKEGQALIEKQIKEFEAHQPLSPSE